MKSRVVRAGDQDINYILKTSYRATRMRLTVYIDRGLVVTKPWLLSNSLVDNFIIKKSKWIIDKLSNCKKAKCSKGEYLKNKSEAQEFLNQRVELLNQKYSFKYNKVRVKNQRTCWGSCSSRGNLNFNYRLLFLPEKISDYIIIHELCHLKEMNHSTRFWDLVGQSVPDYIKIRKKLKKEISLT